MVDEYSAVRYNSVNKMINEVNFMKYNTGLSENEWYIMQILWENSSATLRELCDSLKDSKGWTKHAISSFLKRMQEKGAITADESGNVKRYLPLWDKEETILEETHSIMDRVYQGNLLLMVSNAVKEQKLTKEEIDELRNMLDCMDQ